MKKAFFFIVTVLFFLDTSSAMATVDNKLSKKAVSISNQEIKEKIKYPV